MANVSFGVEATVGRLAGTLALNEKMHLTSAYKSTSHTLQRKTISDLLSSDLSVTSSSRRASTSNVDVRLPKDFASAVGADSATPLIAYLSTSCYLPAREPTHTAVAPLLDFTLFKTDMTVQLVKNVASPGILLTFPVEYPATMSAKQQGDRRTKLRCVYWDDVLLAVIYSTLPAVCVCVCVHMCVCCFVLLNQ